MGFLRGLENIPERSCYLTSRPWTQLRSSLNLAGSVCSHGTRGLTAEAVRRLGRFTSFSSSLKSLCLSHTKHRRKECLLGPHDTSSAWQGSSWAGLELPGDVQMKGPYVSWVIFVNNCVSAQHRPTVNILLHLLQRIRSCRVGFPGS